MMVYRQVLLLISIIIPASWQVPVQRDLNTRNVAVPSSPPRFDGIFETNYDPKKIELQIKTWRPDDEQNLWELSGLEEGDMMLYPDSSDTKNGLLNETYRWPEGIVPYYIVEDNFDEEQMKIIEGAFKEYHNRTCLRFRPYNESDKDYIKIQGNKSGCWSLVGRHNDGQVINLQNPGCVRHGTVVHELMHAVGFYHQQSATDRDEWVKIHWENIQIGKEHNFNKYSKRKVTDYGIGYDYKSVMHYSSKAFSKNGEATITARGDESVKLGQRKGLSKKDVAKLQKMYKKECDARESEENKSDSTEDVSYNWILN